MHRATDQFWQRYWGMPKDVQILADKNFQLLKDNPRHPSLQLKRVGKFWSARVSLTHRVLAVEDGDDLVWVWIGSHDEYERIINRKG